MSHTATQRIQVLARSNGAGLSRDLTLVTGLLREAGYTVTVAGLNQRDSLGSRLAKLGRRLGHGLRGRSRTAVRHDVNLMLERVYPDRFNQARHNVLIPNPEWLRQEWWQYLPAFDLVLAKTHHAAPLFRQFGCPVHWTGFASDDHLDQRVPREQAFLHMPGRSNNKGTRRLVELWARHPEWPALTLVWRSKNARAMNMPANIHLLDQYLDEAGLRRLQNSHRFHLCPSRTEGYGHYITEAMGVGAVVITTDAEPMNELVTAERGILVGARANGTQALATLYDFDDAAMETAIARCTAMSPLESDMLGKRARHWFETNREAFPQRLGEELRRLVTDSATLPPGESFDVASPEPRPHRMPES